MSRITHVRAGLGAIVAVLATASPAIAQAPLPPPVAGVSVNVERVKGDVLVKCPGDADFVTLSAPRQIPLGCDVDTREGTVRVTSAHSDGQTQSGEFWDGVFKLTQTGDIVVLTLDGALECGGGRGATAAARAFRGRRVWGKGKGRFQTVGRRGSASTRGTTWETADSCHNSTEITVTVGVIDVHDDVRNRTVTVRAGQTYVAGSYGDGNCDRSPFQAQFFTRGLKGSAYVKSSKRVSCETANDVLADFGSKPKGKHKKKGDRFGLGEFTCTVTLVKKSFGKLARYARCVQGGRAFVVGWA
jgi:hypothetical protein